VGAGHPRDVVALRRRQAQVARALDDLPRGLAALDKAAALAPDDPVILNDLADFAEASGDHAVLAGALARIAAVEGHAPPARELCLALGRSEALRAAGRADEAAAMRFAILERAPGYLPLVERAEREALASGDPERLAAVKLDEAAAARAGTAFGPGVDAAPDPRWAAAAFVAAGDLYAFDLGRPADARAASEPALDAVPAHPPAVEALIDLHTEAGDLDAAAELIERVLPGATSADEFLERLAGIYELIGRTPSALGALERLAALRPDDLVLRFRLEHMYAAAGQHERRAQLLEEIAAKIGEPE